MSTKRVVSLVLGKVVFEWPSAYHEKGLCIIKVAGQTLRIREKSRVVGYIKEGGRYLIGYTSNAYADTITLLVHNPTMMRYFRTLERQKMGSLPTREVWKKKKSRKKPR